MWKWCFTENDGKLKTGWFQEGSTWYYLYSNGVAAQNEWLKYKNEWYWFGNNCKMATNTVIGNWVCGPDGIAKERATSDDKLYYFIKKFEGLRLDRYICPAGVPTIGVGCTNPKWVNKGHITEAEAIQAFKEDIEMFKDGVESLLAARKVTLVQHKKDALISFAYNCGLAALSSSTLLRRISGGSSDPMITDAFMMWTKGGGITLPGLVTRRKAEANLYCNGRY